MILTSAFVFKWVHPIHCVVVYVVQFFLVLGLRFSLAGIGRPFDKSVFRVASALSSLCLGAVLELSIRHPVGCVLIMAITIFRPQDPQID